MGRATFAGIGRPLPGRRNIVVSTSCAPARGITVCRSFAEAVEEARRFGAPLFYIGGVQIYRQALLRADFLDISWVRQETPGDRFFPPFAAAEWSEFMREDHDAFVHVRYQRNCQSL
jgi:dihydrofolate reductase